MDKLVELYRSASGRFCHHLTGICSYTPVEEKGEIFVEEYNEDKVRIRLNDGLLSKLPEGTNSFIIGDYTHCFEFGCNGKLRFKVKLYQIDSETEKKIKDIINENSEK